MTQPNFDGIRVWAKMNHVNVEPLFTYIDKLERENKRLERIEAAAMEALAIMAPHPPEPWPSYASAVSVLANALHKREET